jgi:hypothetical protein
MAARTKKARPGTRLKLGASVLAAARAVDTRPVRESLRRFEQAHRRYVEAQRKVDAAQSALDGAKGNPRKNPFKAFGAPSPSTIGRLAAADGVQAIERLVAAVVHRHGAAENGVEGAQSALGAARAVARALEAVAKRQTASATRG